MTPEQDKMLQDVIKRAWKDEAFKEKLLKDPKSALKEIGHNVPDFVEISFHENSTTKMNFVLPANPADTKLSDSALDKVSGGVTWDTWGQGASTCVNVTGC